MALALLSCVLSSVLVLDLDGYLLSDSMVGNLKTAAIIFLCFSALFYWSYKMNKRDG